MATHNFDKLVKSYIQLLSRKCEKVVWFANEITRFTFSTYKSNIFRLYMVLMYKRKSFAIPNLPILVVFKGKTGVRPKQSKIKNLSVPSTWNSNIQTLLYERLNFKAMDGWALVRFRPLEMGLNSELEMILLIMHSPTNVNWAKVVLPNLQAYNTTIEMFWVKKDIICAVSLSKCKIPLLLKHMCTNKPKKRNEKKISVIKHNPSKRTAQE